ncbi:Mth938-like domain-containing protein [Limnohabitans sp.]|uniref:Mth938-like domain-containing protein n=1 Tax=Limnohabitans sp. TaxID=1907725 RepID=UPI003341656E
MKLQPDRIETQSVTAYGSGWIAIQGEKIMHSILITSEGVRLDWDCKSFDDLGPEHFLLLSKLDVELVIFGSGERHRFPKPEWQAGLMQRRIGLETMDTQAACRTYNILAGEGRKVAAALLIETCTSNN